MEERLAVRQRQESEAEAQRLEEAEKQAVAQAAAAGGGGEKGTMKDAKAEESRPGEEADEAAATANSTAAVATGTDVAQPEGREQQEHDSLDTAAGNTIGTVGVATAGAAGTDLPAFMQDMAETGLGTDGVEPFPERRGDERGDSDLKLQENENEEHDKDPSISTALTQNDASQGEKMFQKGSEEKTKEAPSENPQDQLLVSAAAATTAATTAAAAAGDGDGNTTKAETDINPARKELTRQKEDIALLLKQAREGMVFVKQSIDMADVLRGFVFTRHGVPVRDPAISRELLQEGRSTTRDRFLT